MGKNKKYVTVGIITIVVLLLIAIVGVMVNQNKPKNTSLLKLNSSGEAIPTVDSSVTADLKVAANGKEVTLNVRGIPAATNTVEYELSYETAQQGIQGVVGTVNLKGETVLERKITLGTCSTGGKCVYHQVVGKIKLTLKFAGEYGERLLEKEVLI